MTPTPNQKPQPHHLECGQWMKDESREQEWHRKFRDLPYCLNEGCCDLCTYCQAAERFGKASPWKWNPMKTWTPPATMG